MFDRMRIFAALAVALTLTGCISDRMATTTEPAMVTAPPADKAVMVFLRPSTFGYGIQSSVFDVTASQPIFVGIVSSTTKIAYASPPGARRFMVVAESADFMDAQLDPGKTYYALVTPRLGVWKARFSLRPVHTDDTELAEQLKECSWLENTPASEAWATENERSIETKLDTNLPRWLGKADRPLLKAQDAR